MASERRPAQEFSEIRLQDNAMHIHMSSSSIYMTGRPMAWQAPGPTIGKIDIHAGPAFTQVAVYMKPGTNIRMQDSLLSLRRCVLHF